MRAELLVKWKFMSAVMEKLRRISQCLILGKPRSGEKHSNVVSVFS